MNALKPVKNHKGSVLVMMAISLVVLIASVGLAIDSGLGYIIKAKLNAAVDAAGIAASRAVSQGDTQAEQIDNATQAAKRFFHANYPDGFLNSTPNPLDTALHDPVVAVAFCPPFCPSGATDQGKVFIDVSANAVVPVTFMRVMNFNLLSVSAVSQVVRKDLDLAFVVDTTDSMSGVVPQVKSAAKSFLDFLNPTTDRVALIHFAYGGVVDDPIRPVNRGFDRTAMQTHIDNLDYNLGGFTNYSEGMWHARNQLNNVITPVNRSSMRVIVFFSDGSPNTFASYFAFQNPASCSNQPGAIATGAGGSGTPHGLYRYDLQNQTVSGCYWSSITSHLTTTALPAWYNAHNVNDQEFPVVTATPRVVTNSTSSTNIWRNVNRAARNLGESMAAKSRSEGIYVFTLGLGSHLSDGTGPDNENGDIVLKCMANVPNDPATGTGGCPRYDPNSLPGVYCHALTADDLKPCYAKLASEISRLTR